MIGIVEVLTQNILPIFLVAGAGYALRRWQGLEPKTISSVVFNVFGPALVFSSLVNSELPVDELFRLGLFAFLSVPAMGLIAFIVGRLLRLPRISIVTLILVVMFVNGGNYGLTLNQLRYGEEGLSRAIVYFVVSTIFVYTVGVLIASTGKQDWRSALRGLVRIPAIYAVTAAIIVYSLDIPVPGPLMRAIEVAGAGAIPTMLVILGMQLANLGGIVSFRFAGLASALRLVVAPLVALLLANLVGLQGLNRATSIIEASMPTAVITTVLATEFDVQPPVVTTVVVVTTLLSPLTLALVIQLFGL